MVQSNLWKGQDNFITGGNGFVAAQILHAFLSRGYNIRTTIRSPDKAEALKKSFSKYTSQLSCVVVGDIVEEGAFDEAVKGVDGVVHSTSPFVFDVKDYEHDLLIPAINILKAVQNNAPQVERIIITSSFATIIDMDKGLRPGYTYSEKDWNPVTYDVSANPETSVEVSYCASKAFAEKAAWDFIKENKPNFNLSVVCPPMVYGPNAQNVTSLDHLNTSSADVYHLINGSEKTVLNTNFFGFVDVCDMGEAHARAYESAEAAGQHFIIAGGTYTYAQVCEVIRKHFPELKDKTPDPSTAPIENAYNFSNEKARKELGMDFRNLGTTIHDQVLEFLNLEKKLGKA